MHVSQNHGFLKWRSMTNLSQNILKYENFEHCRLHWYQHHEKQILEWHLKWICLIEQAVLMVVNVMSRYIHMTSWCRVLWMSKDKKLQFGFVLLLQFLREYIQKIYIKTPYRSHLNTTIWHINQISCFMKWSNIKYIRVKLSPFAIWYGMKYSIINKFYKTPFCNECIQALL